MVSTIVVTLLGFSWVAASLATNESSLAPVASDRPYPVAKASQGTGRPFQTFEGACPNFAISGAVRPESSPGAKDGAVDVVIKQGEPPYEVKWSNGDTTQDLRGAGAGDYEVRVTDANGCAVEASFALNDCGAPTSLVAVVETTNGAELAWSHQAAELYLVAHRCASCGDSEWDIAMTKTNSIRLIGLKACAVHAYLVVSRCGPGENTPSKLSVFTTKGCDVN